jgi:hypothetical protein
MTGGQRFGGPKGGGRYDLPFAIGVADRLPTHVLRLNFVDFGSEAEMSDDDMNAERREFERRDTRIEAVLHLDRPIDGFIVNASLGGFLFEPVVDVEPGREGTLEFLGTATAVPVTVVETTPRGTHLKLEADEDVYMELASMSEDMAALLIIAVGIKP